MITCIAIDDEPKALEIIRNHVSKLDFLRLENTFTDPFQALSYLAVHPVDLMFLDIDMPDIDGIQIARHFKQSALIIFTTAHSEYALESYEVEAVDYLLKPFDAARFLTAVNKVKERLASKSTAAEDYFFVNTGHQKKRLLYTEICCIRAEGNYVMYHTAAERTLVRSSIGDAMALLPPRLFVQIHRSTIVALSWIDKVEDNHVCIQDLCLPIGANYREAFLKLILAKK